MSLTHRLGPRSFPIGFARFPDFVLEVKRAFLVADHDVRVFLAAARGGNDLRAHAGVVVNEVGNKLCAFVRAAHEFEPVEHGGAVAVGIAGVSALEAPAAIVFALATALAAILTLAGVVPTIPRWLARTLLAFSAVAAIAAMTLAVTYASGNALGWSVLNVEDMARLHGVTNALGYAFCGVLAWNLRDRL